MDPHAGDPRVERQEAGVGDRDHALVRRAAGAGITDYFNEP